LKPNIRRATATMNNVVPTTQRVRTTLLVHPSHPPATIKLPAQLTSVTDDMKKRAPVNISAIAIVKITVFKVPNPGPSIP
jgi:hypothetical protein